MEPFSSVLRQRALFEVCYPVQQWRERASVDRVRSSGDRRVAVERLHASGDTSARGARVRCAHRPKARPSRDGVDARLDDDGKLARVVAGRRRAAVDSVSRGIYGDSCEGRPEGRARLAAHRRDASHVEHNSVVLSEDRRVSVSTQSDVDAAGVHRDLVPRACDGMHASGRLHRRAALRRTRAHVWRRRAVRSSRGRAHAVGPRRGPRAA